MSGERNFMHMLSRQWDRKHFVCVGLDPDLSKIPQTVKGGSRNVFGVVNMFNRAIVNATKDLVCAYKPNSAFYECLPDGAMILEGTIRHIQRVAPDVPIILDVKRGDIGNTNNGYVESVFRRYGADAVTVHPYLGQEALKPFLDMADKGIIVLCRTSNPGACEFQDLLVQVENASPEPLYCYVARRVATGWNENGNCAVVAGATYPEELAQIRKIVGDMPILIPGVGKQGGDVAKVVKAGQNSRKQGMIINSSGAIIFASDGEDFAEAARRETQRLHDSILQNL